MFHELSAYRVYSERYHDLSYWRLTSVIEVDFIVDDMKCAIEVKGWGKIASQHLKSLRELVLDHPRLGKRVLVCLEARSRRTEDGIDILTAEEFARRLWRGDLFPR